MKFGTIRDRIYGDFLMPSRLPVYEALLTQALDADYTILPVERYWGLATTGGLLPDQRYLVLRHDVDTDPATAGVMWRLERDLGVSSSYYFRQSTLDIGLMQAMGAAGTEASYHYEELATVARARRPRSTEAAEALIPEARDLFARNLTHLRAVTGLGMRVVASHGDFLNRRLDLKNAVILEDPVVRRDLGIDLETYDDAFLDTITSYHRDLIYPGTWMHGDPFEAIARREPIMYMLIHPRPWRVDRVGNLRDDIERLREELAYRLPARSADGSA